MLKHDVAAGHVTAANELRVHRDSNQEMSY